MNSENYLYITGINFKNIGMHFFKKQEKERDGVLYYLLTPLYNGKRNHIYQVIFDRKIPYRKGILLFLGAEA